jgi:hypothetical protein
VFAFDETRHCEAIRPKGAVPITGFLVLPAYSPRDTRAGGHWTSTS